jgi:hypothetical protein
MIADGGTMNCSKKCHSIKLNMGEYYFDSPVISMQMGGVDVVLRVQWLQSLGTMALNFQDLFHEIFCQKARKLSLEVSKENPLR